jgi:hypothetical protein
MNLNLVKRNAMSLFARKVLTQYCVLDLGAST